MQSVLDCEKAITHLSSEEKVFRLLKKKWKVLEELTFLLKIPYDATVAMQQKTINLTDIYGKWILMELHLAKCIAKKLFKTGLARHLLTSIKKRKDKIFNNPLVASAFFLDPRYRGQVMKDPAKVTIAKEFLKKLFYRMRSCNDSNRQGSQAQNLSSSDLTIDFDGSFELNEFLKGNKPATNVNDSDVPIDIDSILDSFNPEYLQANESIVDYWLSKKNTHPVLHDIAFIIFAIPPTEVQIERDFSALRNIYGEKRYALSKSRLEDILIIHLNKDLFYEICEIELEQFKS